MSVERVAEAASDGGHKQTLGRAEPRQAGQGGGQLGRAPAQLHAVGSENPETVTISKQDICEAVVN